MPSRWSLRRWLKGLGLQGLGQLVAVSCVGPVGTQTALSIDVAAQGGVFDVVAAAVSEQDCRTLSWIPADPVWATAVDLDIGSAFDAALELVTLLDPTVGWEIIMGLSEVEAEWGFHPRDDLLDALDGQLGLFEGEVPDDERFFFGDGEESLNYCALLGLVDIEETQRQIKSLLRRRGLHALTRQSEFEGFQIYKVTLLPGLMLCYAIADELLVVSLAPSLVEDVLRCKAGTANGCLATSADYLAARSRLPASGSLVSYARGADAYKTVLRAF